MPVGWVELIAALVTTTLLGYAGAIAMAGVQFLIEWRSPKRNAAIASILQYAGTMLALLGLVYRHQGIGTVGLLLVILSVLVCDVGRGSAMPRLEMGLTALAIINLLVLTLLMIG
ncbi:MAG TPA: hypothetical protein VED46_07670 [Alphaproteobacteria bacterium]|nr:hypothetical protein [Alphaproteobacteria bacterium]